MEYAKQLRGDLSLPGRRAVSGGGTLQRFSGDTVRRLSDDPVAFLLSICTVLAGESPATRRTMSGTYLAALPGASVARRYWLALVASPHKIPSMPWVISDTRAA